MCLSFITYYPKIDLGKFINNNLEILLVLLSELIVNNVSSSYRMRKQYSNIKGLFIKDNKITIIFNIQVGCYSMVPVQEFFSYFGVYGFYGVNMTDVENMILYGEEVVNHRLPSVKDIVLSNEVKNTNDEFHELYKNSLLSE